MLYFTRNVEEIVGEGMRGAGRRKYLGNSLSEKLGIKMNQSDMEAVSVQIKVPRFVGRFLPNFPRPAPRTPSPCYMAFCGSSLSYKGGL